MSQPVGLLAEALQALTQLGRYQDLQTRIVQYLYKCEEPVKKEVTP